MDFFSSTTVKSKKIIDFSINTNPLGVPKNIFTNMEKIMGASALYPDPTCEELRKHLSRKYYTDTSHILCGTGANDLFYRLVSVLKPEKALVVVPTYEEYEKVLVQTGCQVNYCHLSLNKKFDYNLVEILDMIQPDLDMVIICNPNNPTGTLYTLADLEQIISLCQKNDIYVVIDESFIEFLSTWETYTGKQLIQYYSNLMIIDGFTKTYSLAGFRIGFAMSCTSEILNKMYARGQEYNVSTIAQIAAILALQDEHFMRNTYELMDTEYQFFRTELDPFPITIITMNANFLLVYSEKEQLRELLLDLNIKIRDCSQFVGLSNKYHRIAIRTREDNQKLIFALKKLFSLD